MIVLFNSTKDAWPKPAPVGIVPLLCHEVPDDGRDKTAFPMWSPAVYPPKTRRSKASVLEVTCLVADVDDGTPFDPAALPDVHYVAHSSYSNTAEKPKYRIVFPLATSIPVDLFPRAWAWLTTIVPAMDRVVSDASRCYFVPCARPGAWHVVHEGPPLTPPGGTWDSLPPVPERNTPLRAPTGWTATLDRPTWSPRPDDYPSATIEAAVANWGRRLAADVEHVRGLSDGRRAAIRASSYHLGRYTWLSPDILPRLLYLALRYASGDRMDDNIEDLLEDCTTAAAKKPGPIEDLVAPGIEGVALPLVVKRGGSIWVLSSDDRTYEGPGDPTDALVWLKDRGLEVASPKGRSTPWNDLFREHGVTARDVVYTYPRPDGTIPRVWDPVSRTLATTLAHRPVVEARKHPAVATWLGCALSQVDDDTRDRVLDWLVTAWGEWLDQPSACLYLEGPGGGGKTMLAHAIASPWRQEPVTMGTGMQQFNEPLLRCPVLHLDEGEGSSEVSSDAFRMTLSIRSHRVELKRGAVVSIRSAIRGVITANNGRGMSFPDIPTLDDLDAIAERILHVKWGAAARLYLARLGPEGTRGWVTAPDGGPGKIAEHLAWLATTRRVVPGSRWVVPGIRGEYHENLVLQVPLSGAILAGVIAGIAAGDFKPAPDADGYVVKAKTFQVRWPSLVTDGSRAPTLHALTEGLGALSRAHAAGDWVVDGALVRAYARSLGLEVAGPPPSRRSETELART